MRSPDTAVELIRDFLLGFIKIHILYHAKIEKIYGKEFHEELNRHGYNMSFGTLYPIFHRLEKTGYLASEKVNINGKIRKYYTITKKGRSALAAARQKANELVMELAE